MKDYAILVMSCDKNLDVLHLFFKQFEINWNECDVPVYIGLEKITEVNLKKTTYTVINSANFNWGERFKETLSKIPQSTILLFLDDFIIEKPVDSKRIAILVKEMRKNQIANISFSIIRTDSKNKKSEEIVGFEKRNCNGRYLVNLQAGLWNKDILMKLIRKTDSPWTAEYYGSIRARKFSDKKFYSQIPGVDSPVIYNNGFLIIQGYVNEEEEKRLENIISCNDFLAKDRRRIKNPKELRKKSIINSIKIKLDLFFKLVLFYLGRDI